MILDVLENLPQYFALAEGVRKAAAFLARPDLPQLAAGRHEIDGERVYAMVYKNVGRSRDNARLEAHRQYIDIQYVFAGLDNMGWVPVCQCGQPDGDYIPERDVRFYLDEPAVWLPVRPGTFAIFLPEDAHMPSISAAPIDKVVVKVAVGRN
ncbi:MAG TPA: YhcH/YjgK/YiaL family protein [Rhodocyclaceae bacterium]|nr:YhcH/YjgK/YiaL family protein [Rhodocyclaceae bacterium]